jgi:predicted transcriptional regulator
VGTPKLTPEEIGAIRRRYAEGGVTVRQLARDYGVHYGHISRVIRGADPELVGALKRILDGLQPS